MNNPVEQLREAMRSAGLVPPDDILADGKLHRFAADGRRGDDSGWYVAHDDDIPAGRFGDWRSGVDQSWRADIGRQWSPAEEAAHRERVNEMKRIRAADQSRRHADAASRASALWKAAGPAGADHPYLVRKRIRPVESLRELPAADVAAIIGYAPQSSGAPLTGRILLAPVKVGEKLSTVEMIDADGRKSALKGGAKAAGWWATSVIPKGASCILLAEGVATALSAHSATAHPTIAVLSAGNLATAAGALRRRYPMALLVVLADLKNLTGEPEPRAIEAARLIDGVVAVPNFGDDRPPGATDFNDLHAKRGADAVVQAIEGAIAERVGSRWLEPQPLGARVDQQPYPIDALPDGIRAAVEEVHGFVQAPVPLVALSALAALSLAGQALADVQRAAGLQGPTGLYLLAIADSGERKTTCDRLFMQAIRDFERDRAELARPDHARHTAAMQAWEAERDGIKSAIRANSHKGQSVEKLRADLVEHMRNPPTPPRVPRLLYSDATPEALTWGLASQWPSAGVVSSEAGAVFGSHGMGSDSIMRNLSMLNQMWDAGPMTYDRRKEGASFAVDGARLTVALQVQEPTLREFLARSGTLARGSGFLARFLVAWPTSTQGQRIFKEPPQWLALGAFNRRIAAMLEEAVTMSDAGALTPPVQTLDPHAKAAWTAFHDAIERSLGDGGELHDVRDAASKTADNAARLAALFHAFEGGIGPIGGDSMQRATRIVAWHLNESRRLFGELALAPDMADAAKLDEWLIAECQRTRSPEVSRRDAQRNGPIREKARLSAALHELGEADRVRLATEGTRKLIRVNPALVQGADE